MRLLLALLASLVASGSLPLLQLLHRALREGAQHAAYGDLVAALSAMAGRIAPSGPSPTALLAEVLAAALTHVEQQPAGTAGPLPPAFRSCLAFPPSPWRAWWS